MIRSETRFYVTGGTLPPDALSYVERQADRDLLTALRAGEYCYLLNSRQMGKSSLCVRAISRLRQEGIRTVFLDLTKFGGRNLTAEQWYAALLAETGRELGLRAECLAYWKEHPELPPVQRLFGAITEVALKDSDESKVMSDEPGLPTHHSSLITHHSRLVIFVDEIDVTRSLPFNTDEFFAAIRQCYVGRATEPALKQVTFCLLGTATPAELIEDTRISPFNIGRRIEVRDFTAEEAAPLARGISDFGFRISECQALLRRILYWTGGHPYLTQRLCRAVADAVAANPKSEIRNPKSFVDRLCEGLFLTHTAKEGDDNLALVRNRLLKSDMDLASLLELYGKLRAGKGVADDETNALCGVLKLSGVAKVESGRLVVRNRIYERVFDRGWVTQHMPDAELQRQKAAYRRGLVRATTLAGVVVAVMGGLAFTAVNQARRADANARAEVRQRQIAQGQRQEAVEQRQLAEERRQEADKQRQIAQRASGIAEERRRAADQQWRRAEEARRNERELLARAQLERGVRLLEAGDTFGLLDLLQAHQTAADLPPLRDAAALVWAGWHAAADSRLTRVMGHEKSVLAMAISIDGKLLATGSADNTARVWDTATGDPCGPPLRHQGPVNAVVFSPDGKRLATASADRTARLWDTRTGRPSGPPLRHADVVRAVVFSPDGKLLATGSEDKTARLWEVGTSPGRTPGPIQARGRPLRHPEGVHLVAFSPDGRLLATGTKLGPVRLWKTTSGEPHGLELQILQPSQLVFSPDGKLLAASGSAGGVILWKTATGEKAGYTRGHQGHTFAAAFSPDGRVLASAGWDRIVRLWRTADTQPYAEPLQHGGAARAVAFSPDGRLLATASADGTARLWETASGRPYGPPLRHQGPVNQVVFSPNGRWLVTASLDGSARLWSIPTAGRPDVVGTAEEGPAAGPAAAGSDRTPSLQGRLHCPPLRPHSETYNVAFSPDGKLLATGGDAGGARLWKSATGQLHCPPLPHPAGVGGVAFSPDGQFLATGGGVRDRKARVWKTASGRLHGKPLEHPAAVPVVAFSPRQARAPLLASSSDGIVRLWEIQTPSGRARLRGQTLKHPSAVSVMVPFSPDGKLLASSGMHDGTVWFWDAATGAPRSHRVYHPDPITALAFSPDWKWVAIGADDGAARIWNAATGAPWGRPLRHRGTVRGVAFSPDRKLLATASFDGTAQVWEIVTGQRCGPPLRHPGRVNAVAFSPDGRLLATGSFTPARLWRLPAAPTGLREMALRTWVALGARRDARGGTEAIPWQEWRALRAELRTIEERSAGTRSTHPWWVWSDRAEARAAEGEWKEAIAGYSRALQLEPDAWRVWWSRGETRASLGQWSQAAADFAAAFRRGADSLQIVAGGGDRVVRLEWQPVPHAAGYHLYRGPAGATPPQLVRLTTRAVTETTFTDAGPGLVNGQAQTYGVAPLFRAGAGKIVEAPPVTVQIAPVAVPPGFWGISLDERSLPGSVLFDAGGEITLRASDTGLLVWGTADESYFVNRPIAGDFQITVRMLARPTGRRATGLNATHPGALATLMIRESLAAGARGASLMTTENNELGLQFQWRSSPDGRTEGRTLIPAGALKLPVTLRLTRRGSVVSAEYSLDGGRSFQPGGDPVQFQPTLAERLFIGLAIGAGDPTRISEARFDRLEIREL